MNQVSKMSWCSRCVRLSWQNTHKNRLFTTNRKESQQADEEVERNAKRFLENLKGDQMKQLKILEMKYEILRANNEPVPTMLTSKQKKKMLVQLRTEEEQVNYLLNLKRTEELREYNKQKKVLEYSQYYQFQRESTFVFAESPTFIGVFHKNRLVRASMTGMPVVFDVGYDMTSHENWRLIGMLLKTWSFVKLHKEPAQLIVAGLGKNPTLKEYLKSRPEVLNSMIEFHDEPYWTLFPKSKLVYITNNNVGPELTEVNGNNVYVLFGGNRWPNLNERADVRCMPYYRLFENTTSPTLHLRVKILMDMSLERDVDKVYQTNFREGVFKNKPSVQRHKQLFLESE